MIKLKHVLFLALLLACSEPAGTTHPPPDLGEESSMPSMASTSGCTRDLDCPIDAPTCVAGNPPRCQMCDSRSQNGCETGFCEAGQQCITACEEVAECNFTRGAVDRSTYDAEGARQSCGLCTNGDALAQCAFRYCFEKCVDAWSSAVCRDCRGRICFSINCDRTTECEK